MFDNNFIEMKRRSQKHIDKFITKQWDALLEDKKKKDSLLRTWEKSRWEILQSYEDTDHLHLWSKGEHNWFGFSPAQIKNLARSCSHVIQCEELQEKTLTLQRLCTSIMRTPSIKTLTSLFKILNDRIPSVIENINTKSQQVLQHQMA
jgi:hypothetical protein